MERRQNEEAQALLRRAIAMEPGYARAHALLGWAAWWATLHLWAEERASAYRQAAGHAQNALALDPSDPRSEEHTSELQSLMRISYAVFCLKKKKKIK